MTTMERVEAYLKENMGESLPKIRYFNGTNKFSDKNGDYSADTYEEALTLFLTEYEQRNKNP